MFDKEQLSRSGRSSEYDARPGDDFTSSSYDETHNAVWREKMTPPRRFWTRGKIITALVLVVVFLGGVLCISQNIAIQQRQYGIQGKVGDAWNEVDKVLLTRLSTHGVNSSMNRLLSMSGS